MPPDDFAPESERSRAASVLRPEVVFLVASSLFIIGFWIWFLFLRAPTDGVEKEVIKGKATSEILAACNAAAAATGVGSLFGPEDVKTHKAPPPEGVSAFVSMLEVSKNGFACQWDGVNAAQVTRQVGAEP